jgi:hypothetical protein
MGPHAERGLPNPGRPLPRKPANNAGPTWAETAPGQEPSPGRGARRIDVEADGKKKHRHGRPRKTGRPGA